MLCNVTVTVGGNIRLKDLAIAATSPMVASAGCVAASGPFAPGEARWCTFTRPVTWADFQTYAAAQSQASWEIQVTPQAAFYSNYVADSGLTLALPSASSSPALHLTLRREISVALAAVDPVGPVTAAGKPA